MPSLFPPPPSPQLPVLSFRVDQLPMSETVKGVWSSLVKLAGSGGGAAPLAGLPPSSLQTLPQPLQPSKLVHPRGGPAEEGEKRVN